jgi:CelD/BcsL family acetyltransferase involved in cellulose biosynthesis
MPYKVHSGREALETLYSSWDALSRRCPGHVFQTTGFVRAWTETLGITSKTTPLVVTYERDGEIVALFPACIVRENVMPLVTWLGGPHMLDYGDILFDTERSDVSAEQFVRGAITRLREHAKGAFLYLPNVRSDAVCHEGLANTMVELKRDVAPYILLDGTYTDFLASLGKKRRHNLANFERRLARAGDVEFRVLSTDDPDFDSTVAEILRLQRLRFADLPPNAPIFDPHYEEFRLEHARHSGGPLASVLTLNGQMIAGSLQCVYDNRMYYLVTAFDEQFAEFAPGKLLVSRLIQYSFEQGLKAFDFCWGGEAYKYFWTSDEEPLDSFISDGPAGRLLATAASLRRRVAAATSSMLT